MPEEQIADGLKESKGSVEQVGSVQLETAQDVQNIKYMDQLRTLTYTSGIGDAGEPPEVDYTQQDYDLFRMIYNGDKESGMQLGALFSQPIVLYYTAFLIARLPKVVIRGGKLDKAGKREEIPELSTFANDFCKTEHPRLVQFVKTALKLGDCYAAFNPNRTLAIIPPETADPGFYLYTDRINSLKQRQTKYILNPKTNRKNKVTIVRQWLRDRTLVEAKAESGSIDVKEFGKPKLDLTHNLGVAPVVLYANNKDDMSAFGWSEFVGCMPFFNIFHRTLARGFEAQQYAGKPVLMFEGIDGQAKSWLKASFDIDVDKIESSAAERSKMQAFLEKFKMLTLTGKATGKFLESKFPLGATSEMCQLAFDGIVRMSALPEFMFGTQASGSNAVAREQYVALKNKVALKQVEFGTVLKQLIKWAFYWFSNVAKDEETGEPLTAYNFASDAAALEELEVELTFPSFIASDEDLKLKALELVAKLGGLSYEDAFENLESIIPDPQTSLNRVRQEFADATLPPKPTFESDGDDEAEGEAKRTNQRSNDDKGNAGSNSGKTGKGAKTTSGRGGRN